MSSSRSGRAAPAKRPVSRAQLTFNDTFQAAGERPIAAIRARRHAQAQAARESTQASPDDASGAAQHGLRRRRSGEALQPPAQTTAAPTVRRVAPRIGVSGKQQSEPAAAFSQPPTQRLRTTPSASDLGVMAGSQRAQRPELATPPTPPNRVLYPPRPLGSAPSNRVAPKASTVRGTRAASVVAKAGFTSGSVGRAAHGDSPVGLRLGARQPLPSPGAIGSEGKPRASFIPQPAAPVDRSVIPAQQGSMLIDRYQEKSRELALERETNNQLFAEMRRMATITESLEAKLAQAEAEAHAAKQRAARAEDELSEHRTKNAALADKVAALTTVANALAAARSDSLCSPRASRGTAELARQHSNEGDEAVGLDGHWRDNYARMTATIGAVRDSYQTGASEPVRRDLNILDEYLRDSARTERSTANEPPSSATRAQVADGSSAGARRPSSPRLFTPRQRRLAAQDERGHRRRSTMLFAGLIRPSGSAPPRESSVQRVVSGADDGTHAYVCGRCEQLQESLQAVVVDNSYYREANDKLRGSVADMVSSHNAMVRVFERERKRRREGRAHELAEASHMAARNRALLEARQRAELGMDMGDELAQRFSQALHIASPADRRYVGSAVSGSPAAAPV